MLFNRCVVIGQLGLTTAALPTRCQPPLTVAPLAGFDHIRRAHAEAFRHLPRALVITRQHSISDILRIGLPTPPRHRRLQQMPELDESQQAPVP